MILAKFTWFHFFFQTKLEKLYPPQELTAKEKKKIQKMEKFLKKQEEEEKKQREKLIALLSPLSSEKDYSLNDLANEWDVTIPITTKNVELLQKFGYMINSVKKFTGSPGRPVQQFRMTSKAQEDLAYESADGNKKDKKKKKKKKATEDTFVYKPVAPGQKKNLDDMPAQYQPEIVQRDWYEWWSQQKFFKPEYNEVSNFSFC